MSEVDVRTSDLIQAEMLRRQYPKIVKHLNGGEMLLAVSFRKTPYLAGLSCVLVGAVLLLVAVTLYFRPFNMLAIPAVLICIFLIWAGIRLIVFIRNECIFLTDSRVAHQKVDVFGRLSDGPYSIPLSDVVSVQLYRYAMGFANKKDGDIYIRRKGKSYLIPTIQGGVVFVELLITEVRRVRSAEHGD